MDAPIYAVYVTPLFFRNPHIRQGTDFQLREDLRNSGLKAEADGAILGESAADVAARSEVTITMVPDGPEVEVAVLGQAGALQGARPGSVIVDMSSISLLSPKKWGRPAPPEGWISWTRP
jgi:3-hydroxyisobutyrate dehydrogenase-like beta-hydroxyacid dehydrogenase